MVIAHQPLRFVAIALAQGCACVWTCRSSDAVVIEYTAVLWCPCKCLGRKMLILTDPARSPADAWNWSGVMVGSSRMSTDEAVMCTDVPLCAKEHDALEVVISSALVRSAASASA
jgi:hypothetical protein